MLRSCYKAVLPHSTGARFIKFMFQNSYVSDLTLLAGAQSYLDKIRKYLTLTNKIQSLEQIGRF